MVGWPIIRNWRITAIPQDRHMLTLLQVIWYWESFLKHKQAREIGWLPSNSLSPQFYRALFPFQPIRPQISISREREGRRERWEEKNRERAELERWDGCGKAKVEMEAKGRKFQESFAGNVGAVEKQEASER